MCASNKKYHKSFQWHDMSARSSDFPIIPIIKYIHLFKPDCYHLIRRAKCCNPCNVRISEIIMQKLSVFRGGCQCATPSSQLQWDGRASVRSPSFHFLFLQFCVIGIDNPTMSQLRIFHTAVNALCSVAWPGWEEEEERRGKWPRRNKCWMSDSDRNIA